MNPKHFGPILIVEDEENLGITLSEYLQGLEYECYWAENGTKASQYFKNKKPQIVLMDIGLPDTDGITLAKEFRQQRKDFVLLFLSAQNDPETRVQGLEIGAQDYITKPFALKELTLRLERILKFQAGINQTPKEIKIGPLTINFKSFEVTDANKKIITLSQKECAILKMLYDYNNQVISREQILEEIWGQENYPTNRTVDNYIVKLRKWCETDQDQNIEIKTIRGIGYKLIKKKR